MSRTRIKAPKPFIEAEPPEALHGSAPCKRALLRHSSSRHFSDVDNDGGST